MEKPFSTSFNKVCDIESKSKGSIIIIEDPLTQKRFVQKIVKNNTKEVDINTFFSNAATIKKLSIYQGILPIICFSYQDYPIIITEYKTNGTLNDFITKRQNKENKQNYTDSKTLIILFGIACTMKYLQFNDLYLDNFNSNKIYLDENLLPQINVTEFLMRKIIPNDDNNIERSNNNIYSFGNIAYELITGQTIFPTESTTPGTSKIQIKWLQNLIEKCWSKHKEERPNFGDIINEFYKQNENYEYISENEMNDYQQIQCVRQKMNRCHICMAKFYFSG